MAKGTKIVVSDNPRGRFEEIIVSGTPKPGTCMTVKAATEPLQGRHTYEAFSADADGNQRLIAVLCEDELQGRAETTAYADGDRAKVYFPLPGDDLNMLMANISGTDTFAIGDLFIVDNSTGKLIDTTGSPESEPFVMMETTSTVITADTLKWCKFTGY